MGAGGIEDAAAATDGRNSRNRCASAALPSDARAANLTPAAALPGGPTHASTTSFPESPLPPSLSPGSFARLLAQPYQVLHRPCNPILHFCPPSKDSLVSLCRNSALSRSPSLLSFSHLIIDHQKLSQLDAAMAQAPIGSGQWNSGLCDCFQDCGSFICSCCCPCIVVGQLVEIIDQGITSCMSGGAIFCLLQTVTGCGCLYTCGYRGRLRAKYGLAPEPCGDLCVDCCCLPCSLAQQYREMTSRGIQPDLGWVANRTAYENTAPPQQKMGGY